MILVGGIAPAGYAWAFPRGEKRVRVGVGVIQPDVDGQPARAVCAARAGAGRTSCADRELLELHSGRIPSQEAPGRLTGDALMVVGDAARHSNPLLGEGIRHVIAAARLAAPIAAAALARPGVVPRERLRAWERAGRRTRGRSWGLAMRANRYVAAMDDGDWDRAVTMIGRLPAEVVTPMLRATLAAAGGAGRWRAARGRPGGC